MNISSETQNAKIPSPFKRSYTIKNQPLMIHNGPFGSTFNSYASNERKRDRNNPLKFQSKVNSISKISNQINNLFSYLKDKQRKGSQNKNYIIKNDSFKTSIKNNYNQNLQKAGKANNTANISNIQINNTNKDYSKFTSKFTLPTKDSPNKCINHSQTEFIKKSKEKPILQENNQNIPQLANQRKKNAQNNLQSMKDLSYYQIYSKPNQTQCQQEQATGCFGGYTSQLPNYQQKQWMQKHNYLKQLSTPPLKKSKQRNNSSNNLNSTPNPIVSIKSQQQKQVEGFNRQQVQNDNIEQRKDDLLLRINKIHQSSMKKSINSDSIYPSAYSSKTTPAKNSLLTKCAQRSKTINQNNYFINQIINKQKNSNPNNYQDKNQLNVSQFKTKLKNQQNQQSTHKLAQLFSMQVELDRSMKVTRALFCSLQHDYKWQTLQALLAKQHINMNTAELKEIIMISAQEHDPFQRGQNEIPCVQHIDRLAEIYIKCNQFWCKRIKKSMKKSEAQRQGLCSQQLDANRKGYLQAQDLASFINMNTGNFYRNRDLIPIFKRLLKQQGNRSKQLRYDTLMQFLVL